MSIAKKINAAIAAHGCHMQQEESLINHIVERADEIRGSASVAFKAAIAEIEKERDAKIATLEAKIQALTEELAKERADHADTKAVQGTGLQSGEVSENSADEAEPEEGEDDAPVDADPKASTVAITRTKAKPVAKPPAKAKKTR